MSAGTTRVVGESGTVMALPDAVATGLIASGVVKRVDTKADAGDKPLTPAQQKAADKKAAAAKAKADESAQAADAKDENPDAKADAGEETK